MLRRLLHRSREPIHLLAVTTMAEEWTETTEVDDDPWLNLDESELQRRLDEEK
jgi:hypothetical protein